MPTYQYYGSICWFLEFLTEPTADIIINLDSSAHNYSLVVPLDNYSYEVNTITQDHLSLKLPQRFIVAAVGFFSYPPANFSFTTNSLHGDIQSNTSFFQNCKEDKNCTIDNFSIMNSLVSDRSVATGIYFLIFGAFGIVVFVCLVLICIPEKRIGASMTTIEPLNSSPLLKEP